MVLTSADAPRPLNHADATPPRTLDERFLINGIVGEGGMATVYQALDLSSDTPVAVKILRPELGRALGRERFIREIGIIEQLRHENVLPLVASGIDQDDLYYVMPFMRGGTLRDRISAERQLTAKDAIEIILGIVSGLAHAHDAGVVHRDVKPENILLDGNHAYIADFGIARLLHLSGVEKKLSTTGLVLGTPAYMSPEQAAADPKLDPRTDIYSVGCVLFEMLAGVPPFSGATPQAVAARHMVEPPPALAVVRAELPSGLLRITERCLAKSPADRFQSARELAVAIETEAHVHTPKRSSVKKIVLIAVAAAITIAGWMTIERPRLDEARVVVLPFISPADGLMPMLEGDKVAAVVGEALSVLQGIQVVDPMQVKSAIVAQGSPGTLPDALALGRLLRAGSIVWGEVASVGDSVRVTARKYRTQSGVGDALATASLTADNRTGAATGANAQTFYGSFATLARKLILNRAPGDTVALVGTNYMGALIAKLSADSARTEWNLPLARQRYLGALEIDPLYAQASLGLAEVGEWLELPSEEWRTAARNAVGRSQALNPRDRLLASGLLNLATEAFPAACRDFRALVGRDSMDFEAMFGLGECQFADPVVVQSSASATGYAFRSSYQSAADAYERALRIVPLAHRADQVVSVARLHRVLPTAKELRPGVGPGNVQFLAWPQLSGDTLAFAPRPHADLLRQSQSAQEKANQDSLFVRNTNKLNQYTLDWTRMFPASAEAWSRRAVILERRGELSGDSARSALIAVRQARRFTTTERDAAQYAIDEVRILTRLGNGKAVRALADSIIRRTPATAEDARRAAPVAALVGNSVRFRELLLQSAAAFPFRSQQGPELNPPPAVARAALDLLWYSLTGASADSLGRFELAVDDAVRLWAPPDRNDAIRTLTFWPALLGYPVFGLRPAHRAIGANDELVRQRTFSATDTVARLAVRQAAEDGLRTPSGQLAPEVAYLRAVRALACGDTVIAEQLLAHTVGALQSIPMSILATPWGPAAFRRAAFLLPNSSEKSLVQTREFLRSVSR